MHPGEVSETCNNLRFATCEAPAGANGPRQPEELLRFVVPPPWPPPRQFPLQQFLPAHSTLRPTVIAPVPPKAQHHPQGPMAKAAPNVALRVPMREGRHDLRHEASHVLRLRPLCPRERGGRRTRQWPTCCGPSPCLRIDETKFHQTLLVTDVLLGRVLPHQLDVQPGEYRL